jgi:hypothetical protein
VAILLIRGGENWVSDMPRGGGVERVDRGGTGRSRRRVHKWLAEEVRRIIEAAGGRMGSMGYMLLGGRSGLLVSGSRVRLGAASRGPWGCPEH